MNREEAINVVKCNWPEGRHQLSEALKTLIPEFQESEEERIRKALIQFLTDIKGISESGRTTWPVRREDAEMCNGFLIYLEKQKEQKPVHTAKEMWKEMRAEVYAQASGNRHEPNYSDDSTKMFSLCDIDEIFEKIGNSTVGSQPAEWSEEDKENKETAIRFLNTFASRANLFDENGEIKSHALRSCVDWLKSLRPQPKQEWSEEDEKNIDGVVELIRDGALETGQIDEESGEPKEPYASYIRFVRSLRPQPHWKPSDAQMQALELVLGYHAFASPKTKGHINSLHNDLQKLL